MSAPNVLAAEMAANLLTHEERVRLAAKLVESVAKAERPGVPSVAFAPVCWASARLVEPERPRVIGGGDVAALLGLSKYANAVDIYARLVHGVKKPLKAQMKRGLDVEPELLASYRAFIGPAEPCDFIRHRELDWVGGHLDALSDEAAIDFKSCNVWGAKSYGTPGTDEVPSDVICQLNWYCWLTDRERWHVYLGTGNDDGEGRFFFTETALYAGDFDAELHAMAIEAAVKFRNEHWLPRVWPEGEPMENKRDVKRLKAQEKTP